MSTCYILIQKGFGEEVGVDALANKAYDINTQLLVLLVLLM